MEKSRGRPGTQSSLGTRSQDPHWVEIKGKAKCTRETKMMSNLSLDLHIDWLPLSLHKLYNLRKEAKAMQPQPGSMFWEPTEQQVLQWKESQSEGQQLKVHVVQLQKSLNNILAKKFKQAEPIEEDKNEMQDANQQTIIRNKINYINTTSNTAQIKNMNVTVDPATQGLYRLYMQAIEKNISPNKDVRDSLVKCLHFIHKIDHGELAKMFHIGKRTVKNITKSLVSAVSEPIEQKLLKQNQQLKIQRATQIIENELKSLIGRVTIQSLRDKILAEAGLSIPRTTVARILKNQLGAKYMPIRNREIYVNAKQNIIKRHLFAAKMTEVLAADTIIINYDESIIQEFYSDNKSWSLKNISRSRTYKRNFPGMQVLLAITSDGRAYFKFLKGTNNDVSVQSFFVSLSHQLEQTHPKWRQNHLLLMDNCSSHKTHATREVLAKLGFTIMFSAPASFLCMPVEYVFGSLKLTDLTKIQTPLIQTQNNSPHLLTSERQKLLVKVAEYLATLDKDAIKKKFEHAFQQLSAFIEMKRV